MPGRELGVLTVDVVHVCEVCFRPSHCHDTACGTELLDGSDCHHFLPLCCPGCACGSYEAAHAEVPDAG